MIFRPRLTGEPLSRSQNDSDRDLLTFDRSRSEQDSSVRVFCRFDGCLKQFCEIERVHENVVRLETLLHRWAPIASASNDGRAPARSRHIADCRTRDRSLPLAGYRFLSIFRSRVHPASQRSPGRRRRHTGMRRDEDIVSSLWIPIVALSEMKDLVHHGRPLWLRYLVTIALVFELSVVSNLGQNCGNSMCIRNGYG